MSSSIPDFLAQSVRNAGSLDPRYNHFTGMAVMRGLEGNDMIFGNSGAEAIPQCFGREEYRWNSIRNATGTTSWYWQHGYDMVASANKILEYLPDDIVGNSNSMKKSRGRTLFLRAFGYNHLVENFQDAYTQGGNSKPGVPYYEVFDPTQPYRERETLEKCYQNINDDLNQAYEDFKIYDKDGNYVRDSLNTSLKKAIDAGVILFLRARVSLCMGNWSQAISDCQKIINYGNWSLMPETQYVAQKQVVDGKDHYFAVNSGFLDMSKNPETIWGFVYTDGTGQTQSTWLNAYATNTQQGGARGLNVQIDQRLYDKIATDDYRKDNFVGAAGAGEYEYADGQKRNILPYANLKFASSVGKSGGTDPKDAATNSNQNDWTVFRLSEVYLMLAEAQAQSGNESDAKATLDVLIDARTNGTYTTDTYPAHAGLTTLQRVQLQTRIEMWGERGLEFYNNKRWNIAVDRTGSTNHWDKVPIPVSEMTMQIPELSINLNGLLEQNP